MYKLYVDFKIQCACIMVYNCKANPHYHCVLCPQGGFTAMMYAAKEDHISIVRELLLAGADTTIRNNVCYMYMGTCIATVHLYSVYMYMYMHMLYIMDTCTMYSAHVHVHVG